MKEWWHKLMGYESFVVDYTDGEHTYQMTYERARDYALIFNGKVRFVPSLHRN